MARTYRRTEREPLLWEEWMARRVRQRHRGELPWPVWETVEEEDVPERQERRR